MAALRVRARLWLRLGAHIALGMAQLGTSARGLGCCLTSHMWPGPSLPCYKSWGPARAGDVPLRAGPVASPVLCRSGLTPPACSHLPQTSGSHGFGEPGDVEGLLLGREKSPPSSSSHPHVAPHPDTLQSARCQASSWISPFRKAGAGWVAASIQLWVSHPRSRVWAFPHTSWCSLGAGLLGAGAGRRPRAAFPAAAALESRAALQMRGIPQLPGPEVGKARGEIDLEESWGQIDTSPGHGDEGHRVVGLAGAKQSQRGRAEPEMLSEAQEKAATSMSIPAPASCSGSL